MPKLAVVITAVTAAALTQLVGVTIMITAWATDTTGTAPTTGLALTTAGFLAVLATAPLACRVLYIRAHDRAYVLYHQHQAQDAALARRPRAGIY